MVVIQERKKIMISQYAVGRNSVRLTNRVGYQEGGSLCYPNPTHERGAIPQFPHSRFGLGIVFPPLLQSLVSYRGPYEKSKKRGNDLICRCLLWVLELPQATR